MQADLIYDVGMNNGDDTAYYLHRGYRVVAVEADPVLAAQVSDRFSEAVADGRLTILNVAIAETEGVLPFWICERNSEWNSFDRENAARRGSAHHAVDVQCYPLHDILAAHGVPYYLKIDIEGRDHLCIEALDPADLPEYISFERGVDSMARLPMLSELGFTGFKGISQWHFLPVERDSTLDREQVERLWNWNTRLKQNTLPSKVLRRVGGRKWLQQQWLDVRRQGDWQFPMGASGPFGPDLAGQWQSVDELEETIRYFEELHAAGQPSLYWMDSRSDFWVDIHACRNM